jgi:hypothetical protein
MALNLVNLNCGYKQNMKVKIRLNNKVKLSRV